MHARVYQLFGQSQVTFLTRLANPRLYSHYLLEYHCCRPIRFLGVGEDPHITTEYLQTTLISSTAWASSKISFPSPRADTVMSDQDRPWSLQYASQQSLGHCRSPVHDFSIKRKIRYSAIQAARFVTHGEDDKDTVGPIVIWIATHPTTTAAENAHDASPGILALLEDNWSPGCGDRMYEGAVERLSSPPLLRVAGKTNPTHYVGRFLTAVLCMSISTAEREDADREASRYFSTNPSARVFGVSNCRVLRENTSAPLRVQRC